MSKKKNSKTNSSSRSVFSKDLKKQQVNGELKDNVFVFTSDMTIDELSKKIGVSANSIIMYFFKNGKMLSLNSMLNEELIAEVCLVNNLDFKKEEVKDPINFEQLVKNDEQDQEFLVERCPVVTVMGHVDHGKTTLIDTIRNSHIAEKEAGAITQSIGAYQKTINGKKITFIDTPGHQAFKQMRARGASVTDVIILVVAADDGIMPQTKEAIHLAKLSSIPVIVAINKIDKEGADVNKVLADLSNNGLICEEWGGDTIVKKISAKKQIGIDELLETILLVAEMAELKANPKKLACGTVIESKLDKKEGPKATLLVQNGSLNTSDAVVIGTTYSHIRKMTNEHDKVVKVALPGTPVVVTGLSEVPQAGEHFIAFSNDKEAKDAANILKQRSLSKSVEETLPSSINMAEDEDVHIFTLIKADTQGSAQAVKDVLNEINIPGIKLHCLRASTGEVNENDINLAINTDALVIAYNTDINSIASSLAKSKDVNIKKYNIIYNILDDVKAYLKTQLKPVYHDVTYGSAEVVQLFKASKIGQIAGCMVKTGKIKTNSRARIIRGNKVIQEDHIASLKRFKDNVREVVEGFDCGIVLSNFQKLEVGDIIESWGSEVVKDEQSQ